MKAQKQLSYKESKKEIEENKTMNWVSAIMVTIVFSIPIMIWQNTYTGIIFGFGITFIYDPIMEEIEEWKQKKKKNY